MTISVDGGLSRRNKARRTNNAVCNMFFFISFLHIFISGPAVIGYLAVAMSRPNVYILIVMCFFFPFLVS